MRRFVITLLVLFAGFTGRAAFTQEKADSVEAAALQEATRILSGTWIKYTSGRIDRITFNDNGTLFFLDYPLEGYDHRPFTLNYEMLGNNSFLLTGDTNDLKSGSVVNFAVAENLLFLDIKANVYDSGMAITYGGGLYFRYPGFDDKRDAIEANRESAEKLAGTWICEQDDGIYTMLIKGDTIKLTVKSGRRTTLDKEWNFTVRGLLINYDVISGGQRYSFPFLLLNDVLVINMNPFNKFEMSSKCYIFHRAAE